MIAVCSNDTCRKRIRNKGGERLDAILQLNGRELLNYAGRISHQVAAEKAALEYQKYHDHQQQISREASLKEIEAEIEHLQGNMKRSES